MYKLGKLLSSFTEIGGKTVLDLYDLGKMPPNPAVASDEEIDALITFLTREWHSIGQNFLMIKDQFQVIESDDKKNKEVVIQSLGEMLEELNNTNIALKLLATRIGGSSAFLEYEEETVWDAIGRLQDVNAEVDVVTERLELALGSIETTIAEQEKGLKTLDSSLKNLNKHYRTTFAQLKKQGQGVSHEADSSSSGVGYGGRILNLERGFRALKSLDRRVVDLASQVESGRDGPAHTPIS